MIPGDGESLSNPLRHATLQIHIVKGTGQRIFELAESEFNQ